MSEKIISYLDQLNNRYSAYAVVLEVTSIARVIAESSTSIQDFLQQFGIAFYYQDITVGYDNIERLYPIIRNAVCNEICCFVATL